MAYEPYYPGPWEDEPSVATPITGAALTHFDTALSLRPEVVLTTRSAWEALGPGRPDVLYVWPS